MTGRGAAAAALALAPAAARAHAPMPGMEGFYVGLLHPVSTPAQALLLIGLALSAEAVGERRSAMALGAFLAALAVGAAVLGAADGLAPWMLGAAAAAAALAALAPGRLIWAAIGLGAAGGALIGSASVPGPGPFADRAWTFAGALIGALLGLIYAAGALRTARERLRGDWVPIALRVAAAWAAAIAVLMLALELSGDAPAG